MTLRHYMRNHQISHYYLCWLEDEREIVNKFKKFDLILCILSCSLDTNYDNLFNRI